MRKIAHDRRRVFLGRPTDHHVLAVQTSPRPLRNSLPATLASLEEAGLTRWPGPKILVADGCCPAAPPDWLVDASEPPAVGSARTFLRLLRLTVEKFPLTEFLTSFEDDVELALNALDYIQRVRFESDIHLVAWFTRWQQEDRAFPFKKSPSYLETVQHHHFRGTVAITIPRRTITTILSSPVTVDWPLRHGKDILIRSVMGNCLYAAHFPSIVQHVEGLNSACENAHMGDRKAETFVGETDFDAMDLLKSGKMIEKR